MINSWPFLVCSADDRTLQYMEAHPTDFPQPTRGWLGLVFLIWRIKYYRMSKSKYKGNPNCNCNLQFSPKKIHSELSILFTPNPISTETTLTTSILHRVGARSHPKACALGETERYALKREKSRMPPPPNPIPFSRGRHPPPEIKNGEDQKSGVAPPE